MKKLLQKYFTQEITGRTVYLDILRIIASVFVICVHTVSLAASQVPVSGIAYHILEIFDFLFLSCNLLFVMISGALLLPVRDESTGAFYKKRLGKILIPLVVYYILYVCAKEGISWIFPDHWLPLLKRILTGAPEEAPHFWLVYVIFWLYVLTPFLRWMMQHIPDSVLSGVIAVCFIINGIDTYAPAFGSSISFGYVVDSFAGVFLFGYYLSCKSSRRVENILLAGGSLSFIVSCIMILKVPDYFNYIYNNAPTMMLFAALIFIIVKRLAADKNTETGCLKLLANYSFSVMLIHWGILHYVVKQLLHVDVLSGGIIGGCMLMIVLTCIFSLVGAMIVDQILILPLKKLLYH